MSYRLLARVLVTFPVLIACGGGGEETAPPVTPAASAAATETPPPAASANAASAASAAPDASAPAAQSAPPTQPGPGDWEKWTHEQRLAWMKAGVLPKMHDLFSAINTSKYGDMQCKTCHGVGAVEGSFHMPNPELPKLDPTPAGFKKLAKTKAKMFDFMAKQVEPTMASLLGLPAYDMKTNTGFGCFECHTKK